MQKQYASCGSYRHHPSPPGIVPSFADWLAVVFCCCWRMLQLSASFLVQFIAAAHCAMDMLHMIGTHGGAVCTVFGAGTGGICSGSLLIVPCCLHICICISLVAITTGLAEAAIQTSHLFNSCALCLQCAGHRVCSSLMPM